MQTTTGLHTDDYWYGGQTTIRFVCKPLFVRTSNHYRTECEQLLHQALPPNSFTPPLRSHHPSISSQKRKFNRNYILNISHFIYRQSLSRICHKCTAIPYLCDRLHDEVDSLRTLYHIIYSGATAGRTFPKLFPIADKNLHPLPRVGIRGCIPHKR